MSPDRQRMRRVCVRLAVPLPVNVQGPVDCTALPVRTGRLSWGLAGKAHAGAVACMLYRGLLTMNSHCRLLVRQSEAGLVHRTEWCNLAGIVGPGQSWVSSRTRLATKPCSRQIWHRG